MLASDAMPTRRTTVSADVDDLAVLEGEARRRGVALTEVLRDAVAHEADRLRTHARPRFGIFSGDGTSTQQIAQDEEAPVREPWRS